VEVDGVVHNTLSLYAMTNQQVGKTSLEEGEEGEEVLREANSMLSLGTRIHCSCIQMDLNNSVRRQQKEERQRSKGV
jgi:hypothetical protein